MSSANIDNDRSNKMISASFFCSTSWGNFSQVGPDKPSAPMARAINKKDFNQRVLPLGPASNNTESKRSSMALSQPEPVWVRLDC